MKIRGARFEHLREPLGIGTGTPRISWQISDTPTGWRQTGYDIEIRDLDATTGEPTVHSVESSAQILVPWPAAALRSRARAAVRVHVRGNADSSGDGEATADGWSPPVVIETGLIDPTDWSARLVHPEPDAAGPTPRPAMLLRTEIELKATPVLARWYVTAEGLYRPEINGWRVGDDELTPGWTSYHHRLRYLTYDAVRRNERAGCLARRRLVPRLRRVRRRGARRLRPQVGIARPARGSVRRRIA